MYTSLKRSFREWARIYHPAIRKLLCNFSFIFRVVVDHRGGQARYIFYLVVWLSTCYITVFKISLPYPPICLRSKFGSGHTFSSHMCLPWLLHANTWNCSPLILCSLNYFEKYMVRIPHKVIVIYVACTVPPTLILAVFSHICAPIVRSWCDSLPYDYIPSSI